MGVLGFVACDLAGDLDRDDDGERCFLLRCRLLCRERDLERERELSLSESEESLSRRFLEWRPIL